MHLIANTEAQLNLFGQSLKQFNSLNGWVRCIIIQTNNSCCCFHVSVFRHFSGRNWRFLLKFFWFLMRYYSNVNIYLVRFSPSATFALAMAISSLIFSLLLIWIMFISHAVCWRQANKTNGNSLKQWDFAICFELCLSG